jgi:aryl-alcohol dehydrogenase-like predicted oxidoreductase
MQTQKLGTAGLEVSALGLGCMGMSEFYGGQEEHESIKTLQHAVELGVTFWDTSDMYGPYTNEQLLGKAIRDLGISRDKLTFATKFGIVRDDNPQNRLINGHPDYVKKACDGSLKRLGVDYIDLYYQHRVDPTVPIEDTVGAMADLVKAGKVRYLGLSEAGAETLRRACSIHPISALQSEYSLWSRDLDDEIIPACRELGVGLVAYSPLGRGFLTGAISSRSDLQEGDWRLQSPRFEQQNLEGNRALLEQVKSIAADKQCTLAQLALAWVMQQDFEVVPIPGTRKISRLDENAGALEVRLSEAELSKLSQCFSKELVKGERYPKAFMTLVNA